MKSLFKASVFHKRFFPSVNEFTYPGFYIKFSLKEVNDLQTKIFSVNKFNLFSFHDKDHGRRDGSSLKDWALEQLKNAGVEFSDGEIVLQTFPRMFGYVFNPVSFWYCYHETRLIAVICEVNNTFGESHNYVLKIDQEKNVKFLSKEFHVSPFYDVIGKYGFDFRGTNSVRINYYFDDKLQLMTAISGKEIPWSDKSLIKIFMTLPFYTMVVVGLIHYQALKLFLKKNKFYSKPNRPVKELTYEHID